ncbi:MAG: hypothetical protein PPP58_00165 [Natronomonas sp.]
MTDLFTVDCPGCGTTVGPYSETMTYGSHECDCGTRFTVDVQRQTVGEVVDSG